MQWWALIEVDSQEGVYRKRYEFSFITSVKILFPDSLEKKNDAHTRLMMIAYTKRFKEQKHNLAQFSCIEYIHEYGIKNKKIIK